MITIVCVLFVLSFCIGIIHIPNRFYKICIFVFLGLILVFIAGLRKEGVDRDYSNYKDVFDGNTLDVFAEPTFLFISWFVKSYFYNNVIYLFLIYAFLGVFTKFLAIKQLTEFWFFSILLYISYSYSLHELTQIRVGVAVGMLLLAIKPLYDRNLIKFIVLGFLAVLFHYSIFFIFFLWFMSATKINVKYYFCLVIGSCLVGLLFKNYFSSIFEIFAFGPLESKVLSYQFENNTVLNVFNVWQLLRFGLILLFLYKIDLLQKNNCYSVLLVKIYILSSCTFFLFSFNPTFAGRISDMLGIVDIILIPFLIYIFNPSAFGKISLLLIGFSYLFLNLFFNKILI